MILDGSKALRKAVRALFGEAALVQRCQVHKTRNILEYLGDRDRVWAQAILRRASGRVVVTRAAVEFQQRAGHPPIAPRNGSSVTRKAIRYARAT